VTPAFTARIAKIRKAMPMNHFNKVLKRTTKSHGEQVTPEQGTKPCPAFMVPSVTVGGVKVSSAKMEAGEAEKATRNKKRVTVSLFIGT
jgi:hypothetical protein